MNVAIIPARAGSKRIPNKNVRAFCGRPIIAYSIKAAIASKLFDRVVVSTDSDHIARIAEEHGAEAPFRRPQELSDDHTPTIPVIRHAVESMENSGVTISNACCIYATAPFISSDDLGAAFALLQSQSDASFAFPVTSFPFPIQRAVRIRDDQIEMFWPENANVRSQDLEEAYHDVGQFYWGTRNAWCNATSILGAAAVPVVIPRHRAQDIDTPEDWVRAEAMFQANQGAS